MKRTRSQAGRYARDKGGRGEREAAKYLTSLGFKCDRNGRNGKSTGDLHGLAECLPNVHIEVKFGYADMDIGTRRLELAMEQAYEEVYYSGRDRREYCVLWRPLRKPWRLTWVQACGYVTTTGDDAIKSQLLGLNSGKGGG